MRGAGVRETIVIAEPQEDTRFDDLDPAARDVARGAMSALESIREMI